jgi:Glucose / Sorbosone dehydrogenase
VTRVVAVLAAVLALVLGAGVAQAATLQQIGGFEEPIYVTSDPGNPNRLFVVERAGRIQQVQEGSVSVFADLRPAVSCCEGERGLLSIAPAPDFDTSGRLFVDYIGKEAEPEIHVAELRAGGATAPLSSLRNILSIPHPNQSNHYGGQLQFGPEGALFISTGDGGGSGDQEHNAQNVAKPLGKILRIVPDPSGALPYTVPADNPFAAGSGWEPLVWSYGLRNPFRFSFDRDGSALLIGDVGQSAREEVDRAPAPTYGRGWNYGWNCREGTVPGPADDPGCAERGGTFVEPIFDLEHNAPPEGGAARCAIIGGYVVHDPQLGSLVGRYIYGDNCSPGIRSIEPTAADPYATDRGEGIAVKGLTSFGEDSCGRLYAISSSGGVGVVYRLVGAAPTVCPVATGAGPVTSPGPKKGAGAQNGARTASRIHLRAEDAAVPRDRRAYLTVTVAPCPGRRGEPVRLRVGKHTVDRQNLSRTCKAHFRPKIDRLVHFRAAIAADATYAAATSAKLALGPAKGGSGRA